MKSKAITLPRLNYILLLLVLLTACGPTPEVVTAPLPTEKELEESVSINSIEQIKEEFNAVEKLFSTARLTLDSLDYECEIGPKGGKINFYKQENELRLISNNFYEGDHFGSTEKYYLKDGKLFFAFIKQGTWTFDSDLPENSTIEPMSPPTKDEIKEYRFYYAADGTPLECLKKEYVIRSAIDLPVDPGQVENQAVDCSQAKEFYQKFDRLASLEVIEDLKVELCK